MDWLKTRGINSSNLIIDCIGFSNIFLQASLLLNESLYFLFNSFYSQHWVVKSILAVTISLSFSSLWFCTCLCFYYCVKIINLNAGFFHKLKTYVSTMVPWLLLVSVTLSWVVGLTSYWDLSAEFSIDANFSGNSTSWSTYSFKSRCSCLFQIYMVISAVAFTIIVSTVVAIITSLCKHMRRMKKNTEGFGKASLDSHLAAAKTVTSLLVIYVTFYGAQNIMFNMPTSVSSAVFSICIIVVASFPSVNALVLIMGNRKLKNVLKQLLGCKFRINSGVNNDV
ncbi:taste receptor type 2 member 40-like [Discoglossus pictus]